MQAIRDQIEPAVVEIVALLLAALVAWIGMKVKTLVGINIDTALRDSIKASMTTGAQSAQFDGLRGQAAVDATGVRERWVPDQFGQVLCGRSVHRDQQRGLGVQHDQVNRPQVWRCFDGESDGDGDCRG